MKSKFLSRSILLLILILVVLSAAAGIITEGGKGNYEYISIRGEKVLIYGIGLYEHMSADVAIQGIAQDYVTLFVAAPLFVLALFFSSKGSIKWRLVFAGTLGYIFVTYLFYLLMAMYNSLFLVYSSIVGLSFFAFLKVLFSLNSKKLFLKSGISFSVRFSGGFLIFNAVCITFLWLSMILSPIFKGETYPQVLAHYTTLVVQGLDLSLLLPLSFASGYLLIKDKSSGRLAAPIYLVFLSLLMLALMAKIVYSGFEGYTIVPAVFIIPGILMVSITCSVLLINKIQIVTD